MNTLVDVLAPGYANWLTPDRVMSACGTCTLVRSNDCNLLVDCMGPWDRDKLIALLAERGLHCDDITHVVCTHGHPDHIGNLNLFLKAKLHIVGFSVYENDSYTVHPFDEKVPYQIAPGISVIATPGHTATDASVLIQNASQLGVVTISGDLFENERDLADEQIWLQAGSEDPDSQRTNRTHVLNTSDYIVPGHGPMFKVAR